MNKLQKKLSMSLLHSRKQLHSQREKLRKLEEKQQFQKDLLLEKQAQDRVNLQKKLAKMLAPHKAKLTAIEALEQAAMIACLKEGVNIIPDKA